MWIMAQSHVAASGTSPDDVLGVIIVLAFWCWILGGFDAIGGYVRRTRKSRRRAQEARRAHELAMRKLELETAQAKETMTSSPATPAPGLCRHRQAVPVRDIAGNVVSWLCKGCDEQLPKNFSIYEEDL